MSFKLVISKIFVFLLHKDYVSMSIRNIVLVAAMLFATTVSAQQNRGYTNPVIKGFYPDPSVCRVGEDYYLVNSTFVYWPGVPIFHSRDLIHWQQIGNCLNRSSQLKVKGQHHSSGIYAPTIRYNDGTFYMITTNTSDRGNFLVYTDDPRGSWSDPVWLEQGGIDPSLYFEDNVCYMVSNPEDGISLCTINPKTGEQLTPSRVIWSGTGGRYPEAPHIYKHNGWYYLLISEGGTEFGHSVTIARSRSIDGEYEANPRNPILTHFKQAGQHSPIQGVGHADFVEAHDGSWWLVCLAFRIQGGQHHVLGRETFLAPVAWDDDGWPVVNEMGMISLNMDVPTLPQVAMPQPPAVEEFDGKEIGMEWLRLREPQFENYRLSDGRLILTPTEVTLDEQASPTFIARRQQDIFFEATTTLSLLNASSGDRAGISVYMDPWAHYDLYIESSAEGSYVALSYRLGSIEHRAAGVKLESGSATLRVEGSDYTYRFLYSENDKDFKELGVMDTKYLSSETNGGFTGVVLGLYATKATATSRATAEFEYFEYKPL